MYIFCKRMIISLDDLVYYYFLNINTENTSVQCLLIWVCIELSFILVWWEELDGSEENVECRKEEKIKNKRILIYYALGARQIAFLRRNIILVQKVYRYGKSAMARKGSWFFCIRREMIVVLSPTDVWLEKIQISF